MTEPQSYVQGRVVKAATSNEDLDYTNNTFALSAMIEDHGHYFFAVREGETHGDFHINQGSYQPKNEHRLAGHRPSNSYPIGYIYQPIHQSMKVVDIEGATYAYDNNGAWQFAHCSPKQQLDLAKQIKQFTYNLFVPDIQRAQYAANRATESTQAAANLKVRSLMDFADQCASSAFDTVRLATLGAFHRDKDTDHFRQVALKAVNKLWQAWLKNGSRIQDRTAIETIFGKVRNTLTASYIIDWRHDRADAWAAAGTDPVNGLEYCYTLSATNAKVTGTDNLPDPNWNFDAFPNNGITKGTHVYTDGQPSVTQTKPWIIRFYRHTVPLATRGQDVGTIEWTQEDPFNPNE